jgi:hypothetical protein
MHDSLIKRSGFQEEGQKRSDEGTRPFVAWLRTPGGAFSGFQYPTPPERARGSLDRHATYIVAAYVAGAAR